MESSVRNLAIQSRVAYLVSVYSTLSRTDPSKLKKLVFRKTFHDNEDDRRVDWNCGQINGKEINTMPVSKKSAKTKNRNVPKSAKVKLSDLTPKKQPKGGAMLGTANCGVGSSARFKDEIKPMEGGSEGLFALKPVTFRYKRDFNPDPAGRFGLIAEEVEKINPDLVTRDQDGKPNAVRYESINAMLLNEFLKEHRKVEKLEASVVQQQNRIDTLAASLEKVTAQLGSSESARRMAA